MRGCRRPAGSLASATRSGRRSDWRQAPSTEATVVSTSEAKILVTTRCRPLLSAVALQCARDRAQSAHFLRKSASTKPFLRLT